MQIVIETYKGFEIRFDIDRETFLCDIDDERSVKKSYSAIKKFIADWVKENQVFRKFKVESIPSSYNSSKTLTIIGKHGNGNLIAIDENGKNKQVSAYEFDRYMLVDSENEKNWAILSQLENQQKGISQKIQQHYSNFKIIKLKDIVKDL